MTSSTVQIPVMISVGIITGNSGVYISSQNVLLGSSTHSKSNIAMDSGGSGNFVYHNLNYVYDPDVIDTPIDDRDVKIYQQTGGGNGQYHTHIGFETMNVTTISQNSGVFVGDVKISGYDTHLKTNQGQGATNGNQNVMFENMNITYDSDVIDATIDDRDVKTFFKR